MRSLRAGAHQRERLAWAATVLLPITLVSAAPGRRWPVFTSRLPWRRLRGRFEAELLSQGR